MIIKLAWKNIWRNRIRSMVVICSTAIGLWSGIFVTGFFFGMANQRAENLLRNEVSHIQVHSPGFIEEYDASLHISKSLATLEGVAKNSELVEAYAFRTLVKGMAATAHATQPTQLIGIDPIMEDSLTHLRAKLKEGTFFENKRKNSCLIGRSLADKLNVRLGSKVICSFENNQREITQVKLRIEGIYEAITTAKENTQIFIKRNDLNKLLIDNLAAHEMAIYLKDKDEIDNFSKELTNASPEVEILTWKDISPDLKLLDEFSSLFMKIFISIILIALTFGIINTMLMAILERSREIGMLKAIGMKKDSIFKLIMVETFFLVTIGAPFGIALGYITIKILGRTGIDLSSWNEGLKALGYEAIAYPEVIPSQYIFISVMVVVLAIVAAIYPARKAVKLKTLEALRKI